MTRIIYLALILLLASCGRTPHDVRTTTKLPDIYPDYIGVTIPAGIAPLNFDFIGGEYSAIDVTIKGSKGGGTHISGKRVDIDIDEWHKLTEANKGGRLTVTVTVEQDGQWTQYHPFDIAVSEDDIDAWGLTYRRIAPGYEVYGKLGIYQRELSSFRETPIIENTVSPGACLNCHTSNKTNPDQYTFHVRGMHGATFVHSDGTDEWLKPVNDSIGGAMVYPYWHPEGRYCAYSTNTTRQSFHAVNDERIEVLDQASDVLIYEPRTHTITVDPTVATQDHYETYPVFSPDGKTLYYCSAEQKPIPLGYKDIRYNICRIAFDSEKGCTVGEPDTIFNAREMGKSATHPRPSYDGRYLMFTLADYGCFPIWHREADNWMLDLGTLEAKAMTRANSREAESWHNWSPDSHWAVFTSRRGDGLYTRLYICHIDSEGKADKPFLLPQKSPKEYYDNLLYSYNTPDFTSKKVELNQRKAGKRIESAARTETQIRKITHEQ